MSRASGASPTSWEEWRYDEVLVRWRSFAAGAFSVAILILVAFLVCALRWGSILGLSPAEIIDLLLAGGTIALAYAAVIQAVSSELKRKGDETPNLEIQLLGTRGGSTELTLFAGPIMSPKPEDGKFWVRIRNLGPGTAMQVTLKAKTWWSPIWVETKEVPLQIPKDLGTGGDPILTATETGWTFIDQPFAIKANEQHDSDFDTWVQLFPTGSEAKRTFHALRQIVFEAQSTDVEARRAKTAKVGMVLLALTRAQDTFGDAIAGDKFPSIWKRLSDTDVQRIPV